MTHTNAEPAGICSQCGEPFGEHSCVPIPSCIHVGQFPADDVREALRDIIRGGSYSRFPGDLPYADVVDRILSDPRIEVPPRGTVPAEQISDAEVDAAQRVLDARIGLGNRSITRAALEAARKARNAAHR